MFQKIKIQLLKATKKLPVLTMFFFLLGVLALPVNTFAATDVSKACASYLEGDGNIGFSDLFTPGKFIPLIPDQCSGGSGQAQPLRLDILPFVLARGYSFIAGLAMYFFGFAIVVYGIQWMFGGLSGEDEIASVKRRFEYAVASLVIVLIISTVLIELLEVIGYNTAQLDTFLQ